MNVPQIFLRQLLQPHIRTLRHQHDGRHPRLVRAERLILAQRRLVPHRIPQPPNPIRPNHILRIKPNVLISHEPLAKPRRPMSMVIRPRRMEPHPHRQLLLAQHINREQHLLQILAKKIRPLLANKIQLPRQRIRRSQHRRSQRLNQRSQPRRHLRPRSKKFRQPLRSALINRLLLQQHIIKQLLERHKRRIRIRNPKQQHLLKRHLAIRPPFTRTLQPLRRRQVSAIHIDSRELLHKLQQQPLTLRRSHRRPQPLHGSRHHRRILFLPIPSHQRMAQLINHPHRKQRAGIHLPRNLLLRRFVFRTRLGLPQCIQFLGQLPSGSNIGKHNIPREAEQHLVQVQAFTDRAADVKFHSSLILSGAISPATYYSRPTVRCRFRPKQHSTAPRPHHHSSSAPTPTPIL